MSTNKTIVRAHYPSGKLRLESELNSRGAPDGACREYFESGQLEKERFSANGLFNGRFRQWREDGTLLGECLFENGTGTLLEWYQNGNIKLEMSLVKGRSHGLEKFYDMDGKCSVTNYYFRDKKVSKKKYLELIQNEPKGQP